MNEYIKSCEQVVALNQTATPSCGACRWLINNPNINVFNVGLPLNNIGINCFKSCQLSCNYCNYKDNHVKVLYDVSITLADMINRGIIDTTSKVFWGGGEPTLYEFFNNSVELLLNHGVAQLINTNAIVFSQTLYNAMSIKRGTEIQISIDAGLKETYKEVKGLDAYDQVWENICRYSKADANSITLKYIILANNSSDIEFDAFVENCNTHDIKTVVITAEYDSLWKNNFSDVLIARAGVLAKKLRQKNIDADCVTGHFNSRQRRIYYKSAELVDPDNDTLKKRIYNSPFHASFRALYRIAKRILGKR